MAKFKVTIWFRDGKYCNYIYALNSLKAYWMGITDARMASPSGSFYGDVVAWDSVEVANV